MTALRRTARALLHHFIITTIAVVTVLGMLVLGGILGTQVASSAATAPAATQCDPPAIGTGAGFEVNCTITIDNNVTAAGAISSTVTATACDAAAGVLPPNGCTTTTTTADELVTSVDQCNGIVNGGGSNVLCSVAIVTTVPTGTAAPGVTVNQCVGSGTGGGTAPTEICAPTSDTTGATVTQCNGSGNGGGGSGRVVCDVTGATSADPVTVNQCNGSSNGGGSTVTCATTFTNDFVAVAPPTPTTTTTVAPTGTPTTVAPTSTPTTVGTTTPTTPTTPTTVAPVGTLSTVAPVDVIPAGAPSTGLGGASRSSDDILLVPGALALIGAGLAAALAVRRRRQVSGQGVHKTS
jgi:hypothetical protein